MAQEQKGKITKKSIIDYVSKMEIKKVGIGGGLDKVDVYVQIQEVMKMYDAYTEQELAAQQATLAEQHQKELDEQKSRERAMRQELTACQEALSAKEQEVEAQKRQVESLARFKELSSELQSKVDTQKREIETLSNSTKAPVEEPRRNPAADSAEVLRGQTEIRDLKALLAEKERELESQRLARKSESVGYSDEIGDILREARKEGQSIIDGARNEAEQEMIRVLNLRAKYKHENEMYRGWCKRVETEKRTIEEFLNQLSMQYKNANRALSTVKEGVDTFDIERIFNVVDLPHNQVDDSEFED